MASRYEVRHSSDGQFYWRLHAVNGEVILVSETYRTRQGAHAGIASCRVNSPYESQYTRLMSGAQYYFRLKAMNNEPIGVSELYTTSHAREVGIASVKANGPTAPIHDLTAATV